MKIALSKLHSPSLSVYLSFFLFPFPTDRPTDRPTDDPPAVAIAAALSCPSARDETTDRPTELEKIVEPAICKLGRERRRGEQVISTRWLAGCMASTAMEKGQSNFSRQMGGLHLMHFKSQEETRHTYGDSQTNVYGWTDMSEFIAWQGSRRSSDKGTQLITGGKLKPFLQYMYSYVNS